MKPAAPFLAFLVFFVVVVSGCTIPGTDIEIPGIPDFFGGGTQIDYSNDIIIIKNLQLTPGTKVKSGQTLTLYADIQNVQDPEKATGEDVTVTVELYDYCTNLFTSAEVSNPESDSKTATKLIMSPQEIDTVSWTLMPRDVSLITPCELKVMVSYKYATETVTSVTFIDAGELQNRIRRGESWRVSGSTTRGYGPVKVFLEVETQQPVSDDTPASISMQIKNVGRGYVKDSAIYKGSDFGSKGSFFIPPNTTDDGLQWTKGSTSMGECDFNYSKINNDGFIKIVNKESTPVFCDLAADKGKVTVEQTYDITAKVGYTYEFRKSIMIQVEPK